MLVLFLFARVICDFGKSDISVTVLKFPLPDKKLGASLIGLQVILLSWCLVTEHLRVSLP